MSNLTLKEMLSHHTGDIPDMKKKEKKSFMFYNFGQFSVNDYKEGNIDLVCSNCPLK